MATPNIVPRADGEGQIGTTSKRWGEGHFDTVGIGIDPAKDLHVKRDSGEATLRLQSGTFYSDIHQSARNLFIQCAPIDGNIIFYDDSAERMRIAGDGNVGIGTASPTTLLDVDGDAIFNKSSADKDFRVVSDGNQYMFFVDGGTDRVGIGGAAPAKDLHIQRTSGETTLRLQSGGSYSDILQSGANLFIQNAAGGGNIIFYDDAAERMRIDTDGNVGIGETTPKTKLSVTHDYNTTTFENQLADDEGGGTILKYSPGGDESPAGSELFFLHTDGTWNQTDADAVATGGSQLLAVGLGASARTTGVLLEGFVKIASTEILNTPGSGAVDGLPLYVSTTAGHFDFTAPSGSGDFVRIVGYAIDDYSDGVLVYFKPDSTFVELT